MAQPQALLYTKTIELNAIEFLLVQVWAEKPSEAVLKYCKKEETGSIATLSVFRFPLDKAHLAADALIEGEKEVMLTLEIQGPIVELYKKYGQERVDTVLARVKSQRKGMPE